MINISFTFMFTAMIDIMISGAGFGNNINIINNNKNNNNNNSNNKGRRRKRRGLEGEELDKISKERREETAFRTMVLLQQLQSRLKNAPYKGCSVSDNTIQEKLQCWEVAHF